MDVIYRTGSKHFVSRYFNLLKSDMTLKLSDVCML